MSKWRAALHCAAAGVLAGILLGCSIGPGATQQPATYDLGPSRGATGANPGIPAVLLVPEVGAPAWLSGYGIVYRLNYENPARTQTYALSRWAAPPAELLTQRLRSQFAAASNGVTTRADAARADYLLRVELEDFSQGFDAPGSSRTVLRARASLVNLANRALVAQRAFAVDRVTSSPDAAGAVGALGAASNEFVEALVAWTAERLSPAGRK